MQSVNTWTLDAPLSDYLCTLDDLKVWRMVEAQNVVATTALTDGWAEQQALEHILEGTKPPIPKAASHLDFLRMTPFRYRAASGATANDNGSRFRHSGAIDGVFYGAFEPRTTAYEAAFYRALFFSESPGMLLPKNALSYTAFQSKISTDKVLDLTSHPELSKFSNLWGATDDYSHCQRLAMEARNAGVEAIVFNSVRDPNVGKNISILTPKAFSELQPQLMQTWNIVCNRSGMQISCEMPKTRLSLSFEQIKDMGDRRFEDIAI